MSKDYKAYVRPFKEADPLSCNRGEYLPYRGGKPGIQSGWKTPKDYSPKSKSNYKKHPGLGK